MLGKEARPVLKDFVLRLMYIPPLSCQWFEKSELLTGMPVTKCLCNYMLLQRDGIERREDITRGMCLTALTSRTCRRVSCAFHWDSQLMGTTVLVDWKSGEARTKSLSSSPLIRH